ncbi:MAG TPA: hypothetical protein VN397_04000 [Candidatus Methylomirabilis sp.]|nr:hypothetical protein [Candidatus Methylomirabilis sp.]
MLLVCSGEDSYRALEKARELEAAFKLKYDPAGSAVDRLAFGKEGVDALLSSLAAASLFAPRRFFRVDGLLSSCSKDKQKALVKSLERDVDSTIVVTVEEGELSQKIVKPFECLQKFKQYEHAPLSPALFLTWATQYAAKYGMTDTQIVRSLAAFAQGDTWLFVNEFHKCLAGGELNALQGKEPTVYDVIDLFLQSRADRWSALRRFDDVNAVIAMIVHQARSLTLVQAGFSTGIHPYVAQKLVRMRITDAPSRYADVATAFVWARTGNTNADESVGVFG